MNMWGLAENAKCALCNAEGTGVAHVLSGCAIGLGQGRYRYRHNAVLRTLSNTVQQEVNLAKSVKPKRNKVEFVKAGHQVKKKQNKQNSGIIQTAADWILDVDLDKQLVFPLVVTRLRPDMVLISHIQQIIVVVELTCPCEENFQSRHEEKLNKYTELLEECHQLGWATHLFAVEVGARGYVARSLQSCLKTLGIQKKVMKVALSEASNTSLRCSYWIWLGRSSLYWSCNPGKFVGHQNTKANCKLQQQQQQDQQQKQQSQRQKEYQQQQQHKQQQQYQRHQQNQQQQHHHQQQHEQTQHHHQQQQKRQKQTGMASKQQRNPRLVANHPGLKNLGNSCYINSVIQCLSVMDNIIVHKEEIGDNSLGVEYERLVKSLKDQERDIIVPNDFRRALGKLDSRFANNNPQDAHELLVVLLGELRRRQSRSWDTTTLECRSLGELSSHLKCKKCTHVSTSVEEFNWLSLEIPNGLVVPSVGDCMRAFFKEEVIVKEQGWKCQVCQQGGEAAKQLVLSKVPGSFIFHLKRFRMVGRSIEKSRIPVHVPLELEINGRMYLLCGVVNHHGSRHSGHYTADIKTRLGWVQCNDISTRMIEKVKASPSGIAYLLFYEGEIADIV